MRAILSALLSLVLSLAFSANAFAFDGPSIPRNIPFTQNGTTYTAYAQTWQPWFQRSEICYYAEGFNQAYAPVFNTDGILIFGWVNTAVVLNPASFNQSWDDEENFNSTNVLCGFTHPGTGGWIDLDAPPWRPYREQYTWADWYYWDDDGRQNYILKEDLVRAIGIDVKINVTFDFNGQFGLGAFNAGDVVIAGGPAPSYLSFPLTGLNAYTAKVSAVMDYSMTTPYVEDGTVRAFNGTEVKVENGRFDGCYRKADGNSFQELGINYVGTDVTGNEFYLCYDGHPGYDYPYPKGTDINSPANGTLCVATTYTAQRTPPDVWRNKTVCGGIPSVVNQRWKDTGGHNVFYIFHREYINGSADDYMTVYLHNNNLSSAVLTSVQTNGYATVTRDQHVADVGKRGANGYHMHIEVFKKVGTDWIRVDPYGDGANNILWARDYTTNLR